MKTMLLLFGAGWIVAAHAVPAAAQSETAARRECMQAMREQGVRGFALEYPRFSRTSDGASLIGTMVQGPVRLDFSCAIDRRAKVTDLSVNRPTR
ncbi:hypothetical protein GXW78_10215 [Roseomonas terrae]|jgi:hypothetical protein|uniref:PepSY domain-containing protein n=1 Tax=Neoroseomonas terrae TaxID=424799 RepID=A0ABS5EG91_9PROT|nr:hypothetical protein [Neoroseomonas terrae]MBR0650036.1 hypothetical protein [Neoroseomonas terrae]